MAPTPVLAAAAFVAVCALLATTPAAAAGAPLTLPRSFSHTNTSLTRHRAGPIGTDPTDPK